MAIQRLPEPAVRAIGSCQTLSESSSLVKELIDNALDANATSIVVEISTNALDVVQVRDNGYGIAPEDRGAMAMRYSTSKIVSLQELKNLGGQSLGFRGEALSAVCQMAGGLVITTRVEGEGVAEACWLDKKGNTETRGPASHPVGTTVRVLDFLKSCPVRRENALKNSAKTLAKIKRTVQAYAFARSDVRFSLRILKSGKGNWSYAPKGKTTPQLDLSLIIGKEAAGQCIWLHYPPSTRDNGGVTYHNGYSIESFVPKLGADLSKISGKGQFISIDSRPVSCARGTLKQISSLYRKYLRSANPDGADNKFVDPFISMNIICPPGSYDVNIEPAKDDVLFEDSGAVLSIVDRFFQSIYGDLAPQAVDSQILKSERNGFDPLVGREHRQTEQNKGTIAKNLHNETANAGLGEMLMGGPNDSIITVDAPQTVSVLFSPLGTPHTNINITAADHPETLPSSSSKDNSSNVPAEMQSPWQFNMYGDFEDDEDIPLGHCADDEAALAEAIAQDMEEISSTVALNPWTIAKMNSPSHPAHRGPPVGSLEKRKKSNIQLPTPTPSLQQVSRGPISRQLSGQEYSNNRTTHVVPMHPLPKSPDLSSSSRLPRERSKQNSFIGIHKGGGLSRARCLDTWVVHPEMDKCLNHEQRKFQAAKQKSAVDEAETVGEEPTSSQILCPNPSPHSNRYQAAKAALTSIDVTLPFSESGDPRACPIRLTQPSPTGAAMPPPRRLGKIKTMALPLETAPVASRVHDLSTVVRTTIEPIERMEKAVALSDAYIVSGKVTYAFPTDMGGASEAIAALREVIHRAYQNEAGEVADLNINLKMLIRDDLDVHFC